MIGIFTEAVLLEFFIWLIGKNLVGYMVGGAFAILSSLLHKLVSLLILYGLNFIKILTDLYQFAVKQIHLDLLDPSVLILFIVVLYIAAGISASVAGYLTGNKYNKNIKPVSNQLSIGIKPGRQLFSEITKQEYSAYYLLLNLLAIIISLLFINLDSSIITFIFPALYIGFCIYHYKSSLNRFKKISVWIQFALITLIAAFLWNGISGNHFFTISGLVIGLKMIGRAIIIIIGFASISIELKNPVIKSVLYKRGFANLYQSLNLSFSALGGIITALPESGSLLKESNKIFSKILNQAELLLSTFEKEHIYRPQIIIISGDLHEGKTTFVRKVIDLLQDQNIKVAGFLSPGINVDGKRAGFDIFDLLTSQQIRLCNKNPDENWMNYGSYYFNPDGISLGLMSLKVNSIKDSQLVVVDEIGPLELNGKGWSDAVDTLCQTSLIPQLWVVRKSILKKITRKWNVGNIYIFDISESTIHEVESKIKEIITI